MNQLVSLCSKCKGQDIDVYTHGEMLPAHGYPGMAVSSLSLSLSLSLFLSLSLSLSGCHLIALFFVLLRLFLVLFAMCSALPVCCKFGSAPLSQFCSV